LLKENPTPIATNGPSLEFHPSFNDNCLYNDAEALPLLNVFALNGNSQFGFASNRGVAGGALATMSCCNVFN
jgi:hypothetical protein